MIFYIVYFGCLYKSESGLYDKNLYAYCDNNPVVRADAGGEIWITAGIMAVGGAVGALISAASSVCTQSLITGTINWKSVAVAGGAGFVSGAVAASPLGIVGQVGLGAVIGAASYVADSKVSNKSVMADKLIVAAVGGGISSAVESSARFSAGIGISNAIAGAWTSVKSWFSKWF